MSTFAAAIGLLPLKVPLSVGILWLQLYGQIEVTEQVEELEV